MGSSLIPCFSPDRCDQIIELHYLLLQMDQPIPHPSEKEPIPLFPLKHNGKLEYDQNRQYIHSFQHLNDKESKWVAQLLSVK